MGGDYERTGATTGFVSPAGDALEGPIDLSVILDLRRPHRYPVRVIGDALRERGIHAGDILIADAGQPALPATPEAVAGHLASLAGRLGPSGLRRRLAAIADRHRRGGHPWDPAQPLIRVILRRLAAGPVAPARPAAALGEAALRALLASCGEDLAGRRDRALVLLVQAAALRRAALVALDREQLRFTAAGVVLETGQDVLQLVRAPDSDRCPVRALEVWLRQARIDYGAVFRRVTAAGTLEDQLSPQGVWRILRRRAALARLRVPAGSRL